MLDRIRICILLVLCSLSQPLAAQKVTPKPGQATELAQLEKAVEKAEGAKQKAERLLDLANEYIYNYELVKADSTTELAYSIANSLNEQPLLAAFHYTKGLILGQQYNFQEALRHQRIALETFRSLKYYESVGACYLALSTLYLNANKHEKALELGYTALHYFEKSGNELGIGRADVAIAKVIGCVENWDEARDRVTPLYSRAESIFRQFNSKRDLGNLYLTVSRERLEIGRFTTMAGRIDKVISIYEELGDSIRLAQSASRKGLLQLVTGKFKEALKNLTFAKGILEKSTNKLELSTVYLSLARYYGTRMKCDSASFYFQKSSRLKSEIGDKIGLARSIMLFSASAYDCGSHKERYLYFRQYRELLRAIPHGQIIKQVLNHENNGRQKRLAALDSSERSGATILRQQTLYSYILGGGILLVAIVAFLIYIQLQSRQRNRLLVAEHDRVMEEQKALHYRLQALSAQMNPHFIFNSLTSIQRFMLSNDIDNSNRYLGDFSRLMRKTLENSQESTVSLNDELDMLKTYLKLEQMRVSDQFDFEISIDPTIDPDNTFIPTLLIQPYAENAIWHGIGDQKMLLRIHIYRNNDLICCSVDDNGVGRPKEVIQRKRKSFGMSITKTRLELLNILEEGQINVQITDKVDNDGASMGTKVQICFPIDL